MTELSAKNLPNYEGFINRLEPGTPVVAWTRYSGGHAKGKFIGGVAAGGEDPESRLFVTGPEESWSTDYAVPTSDHHVTQVDIDHHNLEIQSFPSSKITTQYALKTVLIHDPEIFSQYFVSQDLTFDRKKPYVYGLPSDQTPDSIWVAGEDTVVALAEHLEKKPDKPDGYIEGLTRSEKYMYKVSAHPLFALYALAKEVRNRAGDNAEDLMNIERSEKVRAKIDNWRGVAAEWISDTGWNPNLSHVVMSQVFDIKLPDF